MADAPTVTYGGQMSAFAEPNPDEVKDFWVDARIRADINGLAAYWGPSELDSLQPPASTWGGTPEVATELAQLIVDGTKTATASAQWDYEAEDEALPERGDLEIVLDGEGHPRALVMTTRVEVVPFDEVTEEHAAAEGEGDKSLAHWRQVHEKFFREHATHDRGFSPDMPVVCQDFTVLHAR